MMMNVLQNLISQLNFETVQQCESSHIFNLHDFKWLKVLFNIIYYLWNLRCGQKRSQKIVILILNYSHVLIHTKPEKHNIDKQWTKIDLKVCPSNLQKKVIDAFLWLDSYEIYI